VWKKDKQKNKNVFLLIIGIISLIIVNQIDPSINEKKRKEERRRSRRRSGRLRRPSRTEWSSECLIAILDWRFSDTSEIIF
jgi:hypothetical protein